MGRVMDKGVMEAAGVSVRPTFAISSRHTGPKRIFADHPMGRAFTVNLEPELAKHNDEELERRMYVRTSELGTHHEEGLQRSSSVRTSAGLTCTRFERAANEAFQTSSSLGYAGSSCSDSEAGCASPTLDYGWSASVSLLDKYKQAAELHPRSREGLDAEWKAARRGDRWRHQWLSVRLSQLRLESSKYGRILASMKPETYSNKHQKAETDLSASGTTLGQKSAKHRHKSAHSCGGTMEVGSELKGHSEVDPVLSQCTENDKVENMGGDVASKDVQPNSLEHRFSSEQGPVGGEESFEELLWKVECLQNRVETLRDLLLMGAPVTKDDAESSAMSAPAVSGSLAVPPFPATTHASRSVPVSARRRASDYDIDNMVMPVKVGTKFVEMVKPAHIETPQWRLVDETCVIEDETSSLEATDDETYAKRHARMEFRERQQRCLPRCNKKGSHVDAARFGPAVGKVGAERKSEASKVQLTSASWPSRSVPRKKRSRGPRGEKG